MDHLCYLCLVFVMLSLLFIAALWVPAKKGVTFDSCLRCLNSAFVTFPCCKLGNVWYLIVLIPDLAAFYILPVKHILGNSRDFSDVFIFFTIDG